MALPPVAGCTQDTVAPPFSPTAATPEGAAGTEEGVTAGDVLDGELAPLALMAATAKLYALPFVKPVTVSDVAALLNVTGV